MVSETLAAPAPAVSDRTGRPSDAKFLRGLVYAANAVVLAGTALSAASGSGPLHWIADSNVATALHAVQQSYLSASANHPILLKGAIAGVVFSLGDITAQAYEGKGVHQLDWQRVARSGAVGLLAQGPLSHYVFSSDGCMIDTFVDQAQGLEDWQRPLAKIAVDQTVFSLAWNSLYFGLLGAMRLDPPGAILADLKTSSFSLLKAGWRLWPLAHVVTYAMIPPEHRLLYVDMVELAWVSVLLFWSQQTAAHERDTDLATEPASMGEATVLGAEDADAPIFQVAMERSASQEMRVLLMENVDGDGPTDRDSTDWQPELSTAGSGAVHQEA